MDVINEFKDIKCYFSEDKWNIIGDYERKRYMNIKRNYEFLKSKGLNPKLPSFMDQEKKGSFKKLGSKNNSCNAVSSLTEKKIPDEFSYPFKIQNKKGVDKDDFAKSTQKKKMQYSFTDNVFISRKEEDNRHRVEICMPRKLEDQLNFSTNTPTNVLLKKIENKTGGFSSNCLQSKMQETKSSKIVSNFLKKMKSIVVNSPPSSFGDDEASDDHSFQNGSSNKKRKAVDYNKHVDQNHPPKRILSPIENQKIRKHRPIIKNAMRQHKQEDEKKLDEHKAVPSKWKPRKDYSHMPVAKQVCHEVIDSFLSMNVQKGRRNVVTTICDLSKLK